MWPCSILAKHAITPPKPGLSGPLNRFGFWNGSGTKLTNAEKALFDSYVRDGSIEVNFMPGNMSCMVGRHEWEKELDRLKFFHKKFVPQVAMQDDVNGLPYGMIESLTQRDIRFVSMNANLYSGGVPIPAPSLFWWNGANNQKILMHSGEGYNEGYFYFHTREWRRGPRSKQVRCMV